MIVFFVPIADLGLLKVTVAPGMRIVKAEIVTDTTRVLSEHKSGAQRELEYLVDLVLRYLRGEASPRDILPHLSLPRGAQSLILLATLAIPRGRVASYSQIAELVRVHPRVVGRVLSRNRILVLIPCHRVVKSGCELGGYTCGVEVKRRLLESESIVIREGNRVDRRFLVDMHELRESFMRLLESARTLQLPEGSSAES